MRPRARSCTISSLIGRRLWPIEAISMTYTYQSWYSAPLYRPPITSTFFCNVRTHIVAEIIHNCVSHHGVSQPVTTDGVPYGTYVSTWSLAFTHNI